MTIPKSQSGLAHGAENVATRPLTPTGLTHDRRRAEPTTGSPKHSVFTSDLVR